MVYPLWCVKFTKLKYTQRLEVHTFIVVVLIFCNSWVLKKPPQKRTTTRRGGRRISFRMSKKGGFGTAKPLPGQPGYKVSASQQLEREAQEMENRLK